MGSRWAYQSPLPSTRSAILPESIAPLNHYTKLLHRNVVGDAEQAVRGGEGGDGLQQGDW
jgi:hypothetical protein